MGLVRDVTLRGESTFIKPMFCFSARAIVSELNKKGEGGVYSIPIGDSKKVKHGIAFSCGPVLYLKSVQIWESLV